MKKLRYICLMVLVLVSQLVQGQTTVASSLQLKTATGAAPLQVIPLYGGLAYFDVNGILRSTDPIAAASGLSFATVSAISAVRGISGGMVSLRGFYYPGDGAGGSFYWDDTAMTTTPGMSIAVTGVAAGRWKRNWSGNLQAAWFGVYADGVHSDSAAMQQALAYALNAGVETLYLPSGIILARDLSVKCNMTSTGKTVLKMIESDSLSGHVMLNVEGVKNINISKLEIDMTLGRGRPQGGCIAIRVKSDSNININNLYIHDNKYIAISIQAPCYYIDVNHNYIERTDECVQVLGNAESKYINITNNFCLYGTSEGIGIQGYAGFPYPAFINISQNFIKGKQNSNAIILAFCKHVTVEDNMIDSCLAGIGAFIAPATDYTSNGIILGNYIYNTKFDGIGVSGSDWIIADNHGFNIGRDWIDVNVLPDTTIKVHNIDIHDNTCDGFNTALLNSWGGIRIQNVINGNYHDNTLHAGAGASATGIFCFKLSGWANDSSVFHHNFSDDAPFLTQSGQLDKSLTFTENTFNNFNYTTLNSPDSSIKHLVARNNIYLTDVTSTLIPNASGFISGINYSKPREVYYLNVGAVVIAIEGSYLGREITLLSRYNGGSVQIKPSRISGYGNIVLNYNSTLTLDSGYSVKVRYDGTTWRQIAPTSFEMLYYTESSLGARLSIGSPLASFATNAFNVLGNVLIVDTNSNANLTLSAYRNSTASHVRFISNSFLGTLSAPLPISNTTELFSLVNVGAIDNGSGVGVAGPEASAIRMTATGNFTNTSNPTRMNFHITPNATTTDRSVLQLINNKVEAQALLQVDSLYSGRSTDSVTTDSAGFIRHISALSLQNNLFKRTPIADAAYAIGTSDYLVSYTSLTVTRTAVLPTAIGVSSKQYIVKDESGNAGSFNIIITTTASQTIDGASTKTINTAYGQIRVYSNGSNWFTY